MLRPTLLTTMALCAALHAAAQNVAYTVHPLELSPVGVDFAPMIVDSSLVFASLRERDQLVGYTSEETGNPLSDLYRVRMRNGVPGKPFPFGDEINTEVNDGPAALTSRSKLMCLTRNLKRAREMDGDGGDENLGLFFSEKKDGGWGKVRAFEHNNPAYNVMHAAFTSDGDRMVFASDMPGGKGGTDLYITELEGTSWSRPVALEPLNSKDNELFPFIDDDGRIFFASNRNGGAGGLDIWFAEADGSSWGPVEVLPAPINSPGNDLGFTCYPGGINGYFSSNRDGDDRIYRFDRYVPLFVDCAVQQENNYCYTFEEDAGQLDRGLPLRYQWNLGDGTIIPGLKAQHCFKGPGEYTVTLDLVDTVSNSVFFEKGRYKLIIEDIHQPYITIVDSARTGREVRFDAKETYLPELRIADWKWDFGDGKQGEGSNVLHAYDKAGDYTVKLDVLSRPDDKGVIRNRCIARNITVIDRFKDMLDAPVEVEYLAASGETNEFTYQTLANDEFQLTVNEGEDVRFSVELLRSRERLDLNDPRFAEIRKYYPVIERYDPVSATYTYSVGEAKNLGELYEVFAKVKQLKYMDAMVMAVEMEKVLDMSQLANLDAQQLNNSVLRVSNVLFATGAHTFEPVFEEQLHQVLRLVNKHSALSLVIEAHTDDQGKTDFNMKLSQRRAQSVTDWFLAHGVATERIVAVGHGENKPIAANTDELHRSLNRRVEFRLALDEDQQANK